MANVRVGLGRLVALEKKIAGADARSLRGRWDFGREYLALRDGAGRLPNGLRAKLIEKTGLSVTELTYRAQFAEQYPTEVELFTLLNSSPSPSWHTVIKTLQTHPAAVAPSQSPVTPVLPDGIFPTVVADPPWGYENQSAKGAAINHYPTMSTDDIAGLPLADLSAPNAHLYLWATVPLLPEAFTVMKAWGFEYKSLLTWNKVRSLGCGNYFRINTEHILFGVRTLATDVANIFGCKGDAHSRKPQTFFDLVEKSSPGPYVELFARCTGTPTCKCTKCTRGWATWGQEATAAAA